MKLAQFGSRDFLKAIRPFVGLFVVLLLFAMDAELRSLFFKGGNFKTILTQTVIVAMGAMGMTLVIVSGGIDLSAGSLVALCSVVTAKLIEHGHGLAAVRVLTVLIGGLAGLANGGIIAAFRMMPFIVTLGMMGIARGISKWLADNQTVNPEVPLESVNSLMDKSHSPLTFFPLPDGVWLALGLAVVMTVVLRSSVFGRYVFAIGSNEDTARLCGIRVNANKIAILHPRERQQDRDLRPGRRVFRLGRGDAVFAPDAGRSLGGDWSGTADHRRGGHRRREPERRRGQYPRLGDRCIHDGLPGQRFRHQGLAQLHAGNHHRRGDHPRRRHGQDRADAAADSSARKIGRR